MGGGGRGEQRESGMNAQKETNGKRRDNNVKKSR